jgi:hypothetical protein
MVGKTYEYDTEFVTIKEVHVAGDRAIISTDKGDISLAAEDIDAELREFRPINSDFMRHILEVSVSTRGLTDIIREAMDKVKVDPNYIPQADSLMRLGTFELNVFKAVTSTLMLVKKGS